MMLFGRVCNVHENICNIDVLCSVDVDENHRMIKKSTKIEELVGDTKSVFVPDNISRNRNLENGDLLFFSIKKNTKMNQGLGAHLDSFLLDQIYKRYNAYPILISMKHNVEDILSEDFKYYSTHIGSACYVEQNNKIIGRFRVHEYSQGNTRLIPEVNKTYVSVYSKLDCAFLKIENDAYFIEGYSQSEGHKHDISNMSQLKNWLKKSIQDKSNHEVIEAIKTLESILTGDNIFCTSDPDLDKQRWMKISSIFENYKLTNNELEKIVLLPTIAQQIEEKKKVQFDHVLKEQKRVIDDELNQYKEELNLENGQLIRKIKKNQIMLDKIRNDIKNQKDAATIIQPLLDEFNVHRADIIKQAILVNTVFNMDFKKDKTEQEIERIGDDHIVSVSGAERSEREKYLDIAQYYKGRGLNISAPKVLMLSSCLEVFKGIFVPDTRWSQYYCEANDSFQNYIIEIDPSIKNISDLWSLYLKYIVQEARVNPKRNYCIHFSGINNSITEIWMKALVHLVQSDDAIIPVEGLPKWPKNIYLFFSVASHKHAFSISLDTFSYFPAIGCTDPETINDDIKVPQASLDRLAACIAKRKGEESKDKYMNDANKLLKGYHNDFLIGDEDIVQ